MKKMREMLSLFEQDRAGVIALGRQHARDHARKFGRVTIDDVRDVLEPLPRHIDLRCLGAIFMTKDFRCVGYEPSRREKCHHRRIGVFVVN